jgi:rhodanese-related sulfurtransferase
MKRTTVFIVLMLMMSGFAFGQKVQSKAFQKRLKTLLSHNVSEISVKKAVQIQNQVVFLDARKKVEYNVSHIKNARWIGYDDFNRKRMDGIPKKTKIIVYCSVGYRSEKITQKLNKMGYKNVSNLYGGIFEWVNQGNKVYNRKGKATNKVHTYNKEWSKWLKKGKKVY